jgi:hypothetical protein
MLLLLALGILSTVSVGWITIQLVMAIRGPYQHQYERHVWAWGPYVDEY